MPGRKSRARIGRAGQGRVGEVAQFKLVVGRRGPSWRRQHVCKASEVNKCTTHWVESARKGNGNALAWTQCLEYSWTARRPAQRGWEPEGQLSGEEARQAMGSNHERPVGHSTDFNFHSEGDGTHWRGGL